MAWRCMMVTCLIVLGSAENDFNQLSSQASDMEYAPLDFYDQLLKDRSQAILMPLQDGGLHNGIALRPEWEGMQWISGFHKSNKKVPNGDVIETRWKSKKGKGRVVCYFKLCSFKPSHYN